MMALTMSHGEDIDWVKVSSSHARGPMEMKEFFIEAKKYSQNLFSLIMPMLTPSTNFFLKPFPVGESPTAPLY
jgi:hypothetical protein